MRRRTCASAGSARRRAAGSRRGRRRAAARAGTCSPASRSAASRRRRARPSAASPGSRRSSRSRSSANCSAAHACARYAPASDAPWPPSFQPRKAAISTGRSRLGRASMRSSSVIAPSYADCAGRQSRTTNAVSAAQTVTATVTCTSTSHHGRCVRYCTSPIVICTASSPSTSSAAAQVRAAVAHEPDEQRREREPEDRGRAHVPVHRRLERPEAAHDGAARMRARRGRERPADDQHERRAQRRRGCPAARPAGTRTDGRAAHLDRERDAERQHDDREQEVREDEPRVQVVVDRDRAERRLQQRAEEDREREPRGAGSRAAPRARRRTSTSVARIVKNATTRFPNSMYEWKLFGSKWCGWQPGQCSQPRPEPVRRTVAPVATIRTSIPALTQASRRKASSESAVPRTRGSGCAPVSTRSTLVSARATPAPSVDRADARQEQACPRELGLERGALVARQRDEQPAGGLRVVRELDELGRDVADLDAARTRGCCASRPSRRRPAPPRARRRARAGAPRRARSARRSASPSRARGRAGRSPVTSVTAFGVNVRSASAASRFSVRIHRTASAGSASPRFAPPSTSAVPSGFVR